LPRAKLQPDQLEFTIVDRAVAFANLREPLPSAEEIYSRLVLGFEADFFKSDSAQRIAELHHWLRTSLKSLALGADLKQHSVPTSVDVRSDGKIVTREFSVDQLGAGLMDVVTVATAQRVEDALNLKAVQPTFRSLQGVCAFAIAAIADKRRPYNNQIYLCKLKSCGVFFWSRHRSNRPFEYCCQEHADAYCPPE